MAQMYPELSDKHAQFIVEQKIFFVGTATAGSRVNVSPNGMDSLRIIDKNRVAWLNVTGLYADPIYDLRRGYNTAHHKRRALG